MARILLADDDQIVAQILKGALEDSGHQVVAVNSGRDLQTLVDSHSIDIVIADIIMPDVDGFEAIMSVRRAFPDISIVAITGGGMTQRMEFLDHAQKLGADLALAKPFELQALLDAVNRYAAAKAEKILLGS